MSRVCSVCGKGQTTGNNVSHSKRRTRRTFKANVQKVSYVSEGKTVSGYVCTRCLKTVENKAVPLSKAARRFFIP